MSYTNLPALRGPNVAENVIRSMTHGLQAAEMADKMRSRNALRDVYAEHGAGIAQGNQNALAALAGVDPMAALQAQNAHQAMGLRQSQESRLQGEYELKVKEYAAGLEAAEAAKQAADIERGVKVASLAETPEQWDAIAHQFGQQDLVGKFEFRDALLAQFVKAGDILKERAGPQPGNDYERYLARERAAGREPVDEFTYAQKKRGPGFSFTGPDGSTFQMGGAAPTPNPEGSLASNPDFQSVPDGVDFSDATGAQGFFAQLGNTVSDAIGAGLVAPENERATQAMENLATNTMIALADGVAGKPSNFLLQEFQKLSSTPNSIWQGEGRTRERLNQTRAMLEQAIMMNQDVANTSETATMRSQARANISRLSRLLSDYDAVIDSFGKRQDGSAGATTKSGISWSVVE